MTNDEMAEMIAERNGNQRFCKNCDDCCQPYNSADDCFKSAMEAMEWKDEKHEQEKQQWIKKACEFWMHKFPYIGIDTMKEFADVMKGE